jgi:hypothetical protein
VQELPADYPSEGAGAAPAKATTTSSVRPAEARTVPAAPSTAAEVPAIPEPALVAAPKAAPATSTPNAQPGAGGVSPPRPRPTQPSAQVAELRGRSAAVLAGLLKQKRGALAIPAPVAPTEFEGPDGELLRLQDEILYLALDALRKPQP